MNLKAKQGRDILLSLAGDLAGGFLYALGIYFFAKSADFAPGGISGLALMANYLFRLPIGVTTLLLNVPLVLLSYKIVGKKFLAKSFFSMAVCTIFLDVIFPHFPIYTGSPIMAALYSGVCLGAGLAIFYMHGSSSGGTDFLTISIKVLRPHLSIGMVTMSIDLVVILLGWPVFGKLDAVLYGLLSTFMASIVIDKIMYGTGAGKLVIIISGRGSDIAAGIGESFERGSTMIRAVGTYSKEEREVLLCACSKVEAYKVRRLINQVDSDAFVMVMETNEVFGEGFKALDVKKDILG
ncbi:YitT family protein [Lacrimispora sp. NSJ-141]|uniref:YitT family protein n=1 Tax=Lientehia hominis TaxID=2897778 RepID=A0AAP2RJ58_9FIRM|nr:YitT family protein [Lientehia hominis]MCD2491895.1 YitT family protein [Lientehia hominis]